jgi:hypothetical protein
MQRTLSSITTAINLVLLLALISTRVTDAGDVPGLSCGEIVSDERPTSREQPLSLTGSAGDVISLRFFFSIGSGQEPVIDVCPPSTTAPILHEEMRAQDITLTEDGAHTVLFLEIGSEVELPLASWTIVPTWLFPPEKTCGTSLEFDTPTTKSLSAAAPERTYQFHGVRDQRISVEFSDNGPPSPATAFGWSPGFDLVEPVAGAKILTAGDGLHEIDLPATGTYTIRAQDVWTPLDRCGHPAGRIELLVRSLFVPSMPTFRRGDHDADGVIQINDALNNLNFLFLGEYQPTCMVAADTDDSGLVDVSDPIRSLTWQFLGGVEIPSPHPGCGPDPTADASEDLGCDSFDCVEL